MSGAAAEQLGLLEPLEGAQEQVVETRAEALELAATYRRLLPHQRHSSASLRAAEQAKGWSPSCRVRVLAYLLSTGGRGATDREIQGALEMRGSTQRPRRVELVEMGLARATGETRDGSTVWCPVRWLVDE